MLYFRRLSCFACQADDAGFLGGFPFLPSLHSGAAPYSSRFTLIGSQDLDMKSHPYLSTLDSQHFEVLPLNSKRVKKLRIDYTSGTTTCQPQRFLHANMRVRSRWEIRVLFAMVGTVVCVFVHFTDDRRLSGQGGQHFETVTFVNCSRASVVKVCREWTNGTIGNNHSGNCGVPHADGVRGERRLRRCAKADRLATVEQLTVQMNQEASRQVSTTTVQRTLLRMGLRRRRRYGDWTTADWRRAAFSDELRFQLHRRDGRQRVRRETSENRHPASIARRTQGEGGSVMVWGMFSWYPLGPIIRVEGTLGRFGYEYIPDYHVHPYMMIVLPKEDWIFQHYNAPCHTARSVRTWLEEHDKDYKDHLDRRVRRLSPPPRTLQQLWDALQTAWLQIHVETHQHLTESLPASLAAVRAAKGVPPISPRQNRGLYNVLENEDELPEKVSQRFMRFGKSMPAAHQQFLSPKTARKALDKRAVLSRGGHPWESNSPFKLTNSNKVRILTILRYHAIEVWFLVHLPALTPSRQCGWSTLLNTTSNAHCKDGTRHLRWARTFSASHPVRCEEPSEPGHRIVLNTYDTRELENDGRLSSDQRVPAAQGTTQTPRSRTRALPQHPRYLPRPRCALHHRRALTWIIPCDTRSRVVKQPVALGGSFDDEKRPISSGRALTFITSSSVSVRSLSGAHRITSNHDVFGGQVVDYWWRVEFQCRGSPHLHMVVWVKDQPNFETQEGIQMIDRVPLLMGRTSPGRESEAPALLIFILSPPTTTLSIGKAGVTRSWADGGNYCNCDPAPAGDESRRAARRERTSFHRAPSPLPPTFPRFSLRSPLRHKTPPHGPTYPVSRTLIVLPDTVDKPSGGARPWVWHGDFHLKL
ncbi:hypothetical protein PR048_001389 [Dryococelus australis]|uniref:Helitron helicase-like domain-containing protein n=1 Tax=Dryococelus australis TaxID=614101 RepID=A0ABQ9IJM2_9NEOP|nr:hypothetical protein PR048_001389 [Dryococelus australis]